LLSQILGHCNTSHDKGSELVFDGQCFKVPKVQLMTKCGTFEDNPALLGKPYHVKSRVSLDNFRLFVDMIKDGQSAISQANMADLELRRQEFGFTRPLAKGSASAPGLGTVREIAALNERIASQQEAIIALQKEVAQRQESMAPEWQRHEAEEAAHRRKMEELAAQ
jgi:hypothetical protein